MVRLKGRDDLGTMQGKLRSAFRATTLVSLQNAFVAAAGVDKKLATAALNQFQRAAQRLRTTEQAFSARTRQRGSKPTLLKHLRSAEQLAALREFGAAKENLLLLNPGIGKTIAHVMTRERGDSVLSAPPKVFTPQIT